ncbi:MAG: hypothetical protein LCH56_17965, partial [Proteobacteria bacterium]|nr:hypothetical protein [Pseudomonadota bacterium]
MSKNSSTSAKTVKQPDSATDVHADPADWPAIMSDIAQRSQNLLQEFMHRGASDPAAGVGMADMASVGNAFLELTTKMMAEPQKLMDAQVNLWRGYMELWRN